MNFAPGSIKEGLWTEKKKNTLRSLHRECQGTECFLQDWITSSKIAPNT